MSISSFTGRRSDVKNHILFNLTLLLHNRTIPLPLQCRPPAILLLAFAIATTFLLILPIPCECIRSTHRASVLQLAFRGNVNPLPLSPRCCIAPPHPCLPPHQQLRSIPPVSTLSYDHLPISTYPVSTLHQVEIVHR